MDISFPIVDGTEQDPEVLSERLSRENERGDSGHYPIGANNFWHGGVHYETDQPVRAVGDGVVVAYRFNKKALECEIRTANIAKRRHGRYLLIDRAEHSSPQFRVESDFAKESDEPREHYSNSFVLTKHEYVTPRGGRIVFYALYMHLLPFDDWVEGTHRPTIFHSKAWFVKANTDGGGVGVFEDDDLVPSRILPVGAEFSVTPLDATSAAGAPTWRTMDPELEAPGRVRVDTGDVLQISIDRYRVVRAVERPPAAEMGLAVRANSHPKSPVIGILPAGSPLHFANGAPIVGSMSMLDGGGWIMCTVGGTIERRDSGLWPEKFDEVVHPKKAIRVSRGDILGYPGPYRVAHNLVHFEIFLENAAFLTNPAGDNWGPQIYRIPPGHDFRFQVATANPDAGFTLTAHQRIIIHQADPDSPYVEISAHPSGPRGWVTRQDYYNAHHSSGPDTFHVRVNHGTPKLHNPYDRFDMTIEAPSNTREIVAYAADEWQQHHADAAGHDGRWLKFHYEGFEGWTRARNVGQYGRTAYDWVHAGWKTIEDSKYSDDGFCNASELLLALDEDHSGTVSQDELKHALAKPPVAEKIRRFVCKHPTEWAPPGKKYERLKKGRWFMPKTLYDQTMEHHAKLEWWSQVPNLTPRASGVWHVHPIEFLRYLKALPGVTSAQLFAQMYRMGVGLTTPGIHPGTVRTFMNLAATVPDDQVINAYKDRLRGFTLDLNESMQECGVMAASHGMTRRRQSHFIAQMALECRRFLEMREGGGPNKPYAPFYGRGAIQLTWADGYAAWYRSGGNRALFSANEQTLLDRLAQVHHDGSNFTTVYNAQEQAALIGILDTRFTDPAIAVRSAGWYWKKAHCNSGANLDDVRTVTRIINGWYTDLDARIRFTERAKSVLLGCLY
ncbi:MAG: hypothetical protein U0271_27015 [Polyangiaceae bacterium]